MRKFFIAVLLIAVTAGCSNQISVRDKYDKAEYRIPMRDGTKLFTVVYSPKDDSREYPIMMMRTPYSVGPYGADKYKRSLGPSKLFEEDGYIFVYQDVRGKFMSEGKFVDMRPYIENKSENEFDETTDTYDTVEWLLKNIPNHTGKVGVWGISYPGFYAAMTAIDTHPAIKAISPQAPIADWFIDDDMHHNGALTLTLSYNFYSGFGQPRPEPTTKRTPRPQYASPDMYTFFLNVGPIKNLNDKILQHKVEFWNQMTEHGSYDEFWQSRNTLPNLKNVSAAVLTVGGWYDGEDLYGALNTYEFIEKQNPGIFNSMVMGPWRHGGWARSTGRTLGDIDFGSNTSEFYREKIEFPFFRHFLKGEGENSTPEISIFETGKNEWHQLNEWPPKDAKPVSLFIGENNSVSFSEPGNSGSKFYEYVSDPAKPVPYFKRFIDSRSLYDRNYILNDQRFASTRPDVLVFETDFLEEDFTIAGSITANLFVSTTGTDADWVVKVIDVFPYDMENPDPNPNRVEMGGYQMLVRGDIMRGKFRNSLEHPEPMIPGKVANVNFELQDVFHTFRKGHKIMIQIQSSWFPLFDRNPQKFVDIYNADASDFQKATQRVYFSKKYPSSVMVNRL